MFILDPPAMSIAPLTALSGLAVALGARHGLDPDHLATIDGLTRANRDRPRLARSAGSLFSLGHGLVVLGFALTIAGAAQRWQAPQWLDRLGMLISLFFLFALAALNLRAVAVTPRSEPVAAAGLRARVALRIPLLRNPVGIMAVGALFAVSLDTVSQAALFAMASARLGGLSGTMAVAACFLAGMVAVDGLNGWWIARVLRLSDVRAAVASRYTTLTVALLAAAIGVFGLGRLLSLPFDAWADAHALIIAAVVAASVPAALLVGVWASSRQSPGAR
jgi:high-affinity nickel-transport protein